MRLGPGLDIARWLYQHAGRPASGVEDATTEEYYAGRQAAARPLSAVLDLATIEATGFTPRDQLEALNAHLDRMTA